MEAQRNPAEDALRRIIDLERAVADLVRFPRGLHAIRADQIGVLPGCRVYSSVSQSSANGNAQTAMSFTTERYDTDGMWTPAAPTRITIVTPGRYELGGVINYPADGTGDYRAVIVRLNGISQIAAQTVRMPAATGGTTLNPNAPWDCAAGDAFELITIHNAATPLTIPGGADPPSALCAVCEFWAEWKSA